MDIHNVTEFANFVITNNLISGDSTLKQVADCITNYRAACACYKVEDKKKIYESCNRLYHHTVKHIVPRLKSEFLSKTSERQISFYDDQNQLIAIVSR